jgi:heat shock protein HslJ
MTATTMNKITGVLFARRKADLLCLLIACTVLLGGCGGESEPDSDGGVDGSALAAAGLTGRWMLLELDGEPISKALRGKAYVEFLDDGTAVAHSGINDTPLQPHGELTEGRIGFVLGATPIMPGRNPAANFEEDFLDRLDSVSAFGISGDRLELKSKGATALLLQGE